MSDYERLAKALSCIQSKIDFKPEIGVILGSGLGDFAESAVDIKGSIDYHEIDGFPVSTVANHKGRYIFGYIGGVPAVLMQGRVHYYEGYPMNEVAMPTLLMGMMGIKALLITNAAGAVNYDYKPGDFMVISDHIASFVPSPLIGKTIEELGKRYTDMSNAYDENLRKAIARAAKTAGLTVKEGVYLQTSGPQFETPAEIRMYRGFGADAVGMSTTPEAIAASFMGIKTAGICCISNLCAGMSDQDITAEEVYEIAALASNDFKKLITQTVLEFAKEI